MSVNCEKAISKARYSNVYDNNLETRETSRIAALSKYEVQYLLIVHCALEDNYDVSFAHVYFHSYDAWNAEELAATDYFKN